MTKKITVLSIALLCVLAGALIVSTQVKADKSSPKLALDISCMKTAVETRETAIQTVFNKFSSTINSALQTRKSELSAAWSITDKTQRNAAIKTAWTNFAKSKQSAIKTYRTERLASWTQFVKDRKACGSGPTGEDAGADVSL